MADGGDNEDKVRVRAYHLWEAEGRPHGREGEFWARALLLEQQKDAPGQASGPPKAKRAAAAKPSPAKSAKTASTVQPGEGGKAPTRRSRTVAAKGAADSAAMHMQPSPAERS